MGVSMRIFSMVSLLGDHYTQIGEKGASRTRPPSMLTGLLLLVTDSTGETDRDLTGWRWSICFPVMVVVVVYGKQEKRVSVARSQPMS